LDLSKIEAGKVELSHIDFDLHALLKAVIDAFAVHAENKTLALILDQDEGLPRYVKGDPVRLRQILINLIGNAIKFTEAGEIVVKVTGKAFFDSRPNTSKPFSVYFSVKDTGIGISERQQMSIFESFSQADISTTRKYGGTGLGLSITRQLVELMGGCIQVESRLGKGSLFFFHTPFELGREEKVVSAPPSPKQAGLPQHARRLNILVAEDNPVNATLAVAFLKRLGYTPTAVEDGEAVLSALSAASFDTVLMDVEMPRMDGLEAARRIRDGAAGEVSRRIPIIAMTGHVLPDFKRECERAGMDDFVTKPVNFYELDTIIKHRVGEDELDSPKAAALQSKPPVLDTKAAFLRMGRKDADMLYEIYTLFLNMFPDIMGTLRQAAANHDMKEIGLCAHALQGACGTIGAESCYQLSLDLAQSANTNRAERIAGLLSALETESQKLLPQVKAYLESEGDREG
jgi:CheY-like chemotaxis protein